MAKIKRMSNNEHTPDGVNWQMSRVSLGVIMA